MRPVTYSRQKVVEEFYQHRVLTKKRLMELIGCSSMTLWRILKEYGYLASYNFNSKYYTLLDIPQFNKYGIWSYRNIRFSKYGSLTDTITGLVQQSISGLSMRELQGLLSINVKQVISNISKEGKITRRKYRGIFIYFDPDEQHMEEQITRRQEMMKNELERLVVPEPEKTIAVLVELIPKIMAKPRQIARRLSRKGMKIKTSEVQRIIEYYQLRKKNT